MLMLKVRKENLSHGLSCVSKTVLQKNVNPLLSNVLLDSKNGTLRLGTTNLEAASTCEVELDEADEFSTTVPFKIFSELVAAIQEEEIVLEYNSEKLEMKVVTEKSKNNVKCLNSKNFPKMPVLPNEITFQLPSEEFRELVERSVFCVAKQETASPTLAGVLFEASSGELLVASADGFRFSVEQGRVKCGDFKTVVTASHLSEFAKMSTDIVEFAVFEKSVILKSGDVTFGILSLSGEFPNLRNFKFSSKSVVKVFANTQDFHRAVRHASIFCPEEKRVLTLNFKLVTEIFAQADQIGDSRVSVALECNGESTVHLNADFLLDILSVAPENIEMYIHDENNPVVFKFENAPGYTHVMMPIRI